VGVADERGWFYGVTPFESEEAARQHQAIFGGKVVFRVTYTVRWSLGRSSGLLSGLGNQSREHCTRYALPFL
jgi:hypothetical protein